MTPEEIVRSRVYDPHFDNPNPPEHPADDPRIQRRVAIALWLLAGLAVGVGIGIALP